MKRPACSSPTRPAALRRVLQLAAGLLMFGVSVALLVRANLGLDPWDVLHQGLARRTGVTLGTVVIAVSLLVLVAWLPLRQRPGIGTVANALLVGLVVDWALGVVPQAGSYGAGAALLALGIVVNALGTALYIGAGLGAGTRDGLMTGLAARGHSIRIVRTVIEVTVLTIGWLLGGAVGPGTVVFALTIGPLVHRLLPVFALAPTATARTSDPLARGPTRHRARPRPRSSPPADAPPRLQESRLMSRRLHVIVASTRPGRAGPTIAEWFAAQIPTELSFQVEIIDLAEFALPLLDEPHHPSDGRYVHEHTRRWSASVAAADAFVLVMPEYNVGFTAPLKNALDYLYSEWHHKPVGFVSYGMTSAGLRAVEMLKPVLTSLKMVPVHDAVSVPLRSRLGADGVLHPDQVMREAAQRLLAELRLLADALAPLRENIEFEEDDVAVAS